MLLPHYIWDPFMIGGEKMLIESDEQLKSALIKEMKEAIKRNCSTIAGE